MADNFNDYDEEDFDFDELDSFDDDGFFSDDPSSPSIEDAAQFDSRIARTEEEFIAEVDRNIKVLSSPKKYSADERRKAALWLGNAGEPKAITALVMVYKRDKKNKSVQQAAEYALGQFKALDKAIKRKPGEMVADALLRPENADVVERLTDIAQYGDTGETPRLSAQSLRRVLMGLTVSFVVLLILAIVIPAPEPPNQYTDAFAAMEGTQGEIALQQIDILMSDARRDVETVKRQVEGGNLVCSTVFANPVPYRLPDGAAEEDRRLGDLTTRYNTIYSSLTLAKIEYDRACASDSPTIGGESRGIALSNAQTALDALDEAEPLLNEVRTDIGAAIQERNTSATATAEAALTATAQALVTPTLTTVPSATPGIPPQELNSEISELFFIIGESIDALDGLQNNWQNVKDFGESRGCTAASPIIRENYTIPEGYGELEPDLQTAADLANTGLALLRDGWAAFESACDNGTLTTLADAGLAAASTARTTFTTAEDILNQLSGR